MSVKIAAQFKKDTRELNGLDEIVDELIDNPTSRHMIVAEVTTRRVTRDIDDGNVETPTVKLLQIEPLDGDAAATARELMNAAYKARTGKTSTGPQDELPFGDDADGDGDGPVSERPKDDWLDPEAQ